MKRLSLYLFLIFFTLQTPSQADDIRDLEIEGMSIGDSALDYFSESEIKQNSKNYYKNKKYVPVQMEKSVYKIYDGVDFAYKKNDKNYTIVSLVGILSYHNKNMKDCYKKMDEIVNELDVLFSKQKKYPKRTIKHSSPKNKDGKSTITDVAYYFKNGDAVVIACYDYSIVHGSEDHLSVAIDKKKFLDWLYNDAHK